MEPICRNERERMCTCKFKKKEKSNEGLIGNRKENKSAMDEKGIERTGKINLNLFHCQSLDK